MKTLGNLALATHPLEIVGDPDTPVQGIQYDSRLIEPGDMFVALRGSYVDGHRFIEDAISRGAGSIASEESHPLIPGLRFENTRQSLPVLAEAVFDRPADSMQGIVGITGTDGKTTTSYFANAILQAGGKTTGLVGTVSVEIGGTVVEHETRQTTPESLDIQHHLARMRDAAVDWAILESTSHGLAANRLDRIPFTIGAVTNITHEHLDFHGTLDAYRLAKASLLERVGARSGWAVVNVDDPGARSVIDYAGGATVLRFSRTGRDAEIQARDVYSSNNGSSFLLSTPIGSAEVSIPYIGEFNVENALCAAGIGVAAGVPLSAIAAGLQNAPPVPGRMVRVDAGQPFDVIVDYAHTPESLEKILKLLRRLSPGGSIICVSGSAGERDVAKRLVQGTVTANFADFNVYSTEDPRFEDAAAIIDEVAQGAVAAGAIEGEDFLCIVDRQQALDQAVSMAQAGDVVLLAGKGHERSIIWGDTKHPWDEITAARASLARAGWRR
ncbi:UDP-N-acetylmuramoyl-L-alanyl-D-glutamate--2,6-diaminopimelate ligase [soil metagenome]